ncbi:MAG: ClpX C4-type zinc finger protein [Defluviitaleaceae bacterium]|nr:ClpX C4-type zinc finger protein [Defluviitaleaceae bacterium]
MLKNDTATVSCSFCGNVRDEHRRFVAGPGGVFICNKCVEDCTEILADNPGLDTPKVDENITKTEK